MTLSPLTSATRAALAPAKPYAFGIHPSVPAETLRALREAHEIIITRLQQPASARQALQEWLEALRTTSTVVDQIGYGAAELEPHITDASMLADECCRLGTVSINAEMLQRLWDCADVIDAVMSLAPHDVVIACAEACEAMERLR